MEEYESLILELKNEFQRELYRVHETYQIQMKIIGQEKDDMVKALLGRKNEDSLDRQVVLDYKSSKSMEPLKESTNKFTNKSSTQLNKMDDSLQNLLEKIK